MKYLFTALFWCISFSICSAQCVTTSGITITQIDFSSVSFSWDSVPGVTGYEFAVSDTSIDPVNGSFTTALNASVNFPADSNSARYIFVRSQCGSSFSDWAMICKATPSYLGGGGRYCAGETLNIGIPATTVGQEYTWTKNSSPVSGSGSPADGDGDNKSYNPIMSPGTVGHYTVVTSKAGCIPSEFGDVVVALRTPVTGLVITGVYADSVNFKWDDYPFVQGQFNPNGWQYAVITDSIPPYSGESTIATKATVNSLDPGTTYYIHVVPECGSKGSCDWTTIKFTTDTKTCKGNTADFVVPDMGPGYTYQWQVDDSSGFADINNSINYSGVNSNSLQLVSAPTRFYGYKYRCVMINGTDTLRSDPSILRFVSTWTGNISAAWEDVANWDCGEVPDSNTDVVIPSVILTNPVANNNVTCRSLIVQTGATLTVRAGVKLNIVGKSH